jgi:4-amino-4-deoxy-L-arabinose transferase-like glycosyltransferase
VFEVRMSDELNTGWIVQEPRRRLVVHLAAVVAASLVATVPFCNKALHIDDTLYLSIARQILLDPLRPFDAQINWQHTTEPAWNVSISPPAFSYWLAGWMALGVESELGLHLAGTLWVVLLGVATYFWARRLGSWPLAASIFVVTGPCVTAGLDLMLDVPMLALAAAAMALYFRADERNSLWCAVAAGIVAGMAVNIKYAAIVALGVMGLDTILWRRWRMMAAPAVALTLLAAGQLASALQYGEPQLAHARDWISRLWPTDWHDGLHRTSASIMYLGSSAGWPVLLVGSALRRSWTALALACVATAGAAAAVFDLWRLEGPLRVPSGSAWPFHPAFLTCAVFAFSGWLAVGWFAFALCRFIQSRPAPVRGAAGPRADSLRPLRHVIILAAWTAGFWYLGALNGPFVAPRSIFPCVLSLTLAVVAISKTGRAARGPGPALWAAAAALTLAVGLLVGAADYQWAGVYREWAHCLAAKYRPSSGPLYYLGHWGWQHYAEQAGMTAFDAFRTQLQPGDVLILPVNVDRQLLPRAVARACREVGQEEVAAESWLPRIRDPHAVVFWHGDTQRGRVPWGWPLARTPLEQFVILRFGD